MIPSCEDIKEREDIMKLEDWLEQRAGLKGIKLSQARESVNNNSIETLSELKDLSEDTEISRTHFHKRW